MPNEPAAAEAAPKKKKLPKTLILVVGVAVIEAVVFLVVFKVAGGGGPEPAHGEGSHAVADEASADSTSLAEVQLLKSFRVPNDKSGRMYVYDLDISVTVPVDEKERVEALVQEHVAEIGDRVARIVRAATDRMLREDDLRALRQQLLEGLREVTGEEQLIRRVLIPRFVPMRAD